MEACFGYALARLEKLKQVSTIAHYTTADTALQIIKSRTFWLRNSALMNDYSEFEHGDVCLSEVFSDPTVLGRMIQVFDNNFPNFTNELINWWQATKQQAKRLLYIGSFAEIASDDCLGRLSMWRAYGGSAGVALCLNPQLLETDSSELSVFIARFFMADPRGCVRSY